MRVQPFLGEQLAQSEAIAMRFILAIAADREVGVMRPPTRYARGILLAARPFYAVKGCTTNLRHGG